MTADKYLLMRCKAIMPDGAPCGVITAKVLTKMGGSKEYPEPIYTHEDLCEFHKTHTNDELPKDWQR